MSNKLGMHVHGMKPGIIQAVELLQPRTITMMDPTAQEIHDVRSIANPIIVIRKYEDGKSFQQLDPRWWAEQYYQMVGDAVGDDLIALGMNEPFGHDRRDLCAPFDEWNRAFIEYCRKLGPMDGGALAMATGNWTGAADRYKITDDFPGTCEVARWFLLHEYCWPTLQDGMPWHVLRYRAWIEDLEATGKKDFYIIISEAGLTQAVIAGRPDHGWRSGGPEGVTEDSYISTIDWYNARLCENWRCLGCCLYDWAGSHYGWETFEQLGLESRIFQIQAPEIPGPPEPPNGDEEMDIKIYDFDNNPFDPNARTTTWEWLRSIFGSVGGGIVRHPIEDKVALQPGDVVYKLEWIDCRVGDSNCVIHLEYVDGNAQEGHHPVFGWPDAEPHGLPEKPSNWTDKGVTGPTNANGDVGPGMGTGSYYDAATERGAHFVWVWDLPSDMVDGIGMLTWHPDVEGNHLHVNLGYQAVVWEEPQPPEPPVDGEITEALWAIEARLGEIRDVLAGHKPPPPPPPEDSPWNGQYFNNTTLSGTPVLVREEAEPLSGKAIDFDWGEGSPAPEVNANDFSVRWTGVRTFEAATYRFHTVTDDGVRLWVGGQLLIDDWRDHPAIEYTVDVILTAGQHDIKMEYYEHGGGAVAKMWYEKL